jgi:hypothetical protein
MKVETSSFFNPFDRDQHSGKVRDGKIGAPTHGPILAADFLFYAQLSSVTAKDAVTLHDYTILSSQSITQRHRRIAFPTSAASNPSGTR